jgi:hypothetical protein
LSTVLDEDDGKQRLFLDFEIPEFGSLGWKVYKALRNSQTLKIMVFEIDLLLKLSLCWNFCVATTQFVEIFKISFSVISGSPLQKFVVTSRNLQHRLDFNTRAILTTRVDNKSAGTQMSFLRELDYYGDSQLLRAIILNVFDSYKNVYNVFALYFLIREREKKEREKGKI